MSEDPERIDPITAERLMRDARSGPSVDSEPLADLLAAAAAPARPGELAGEEAALAAFRDARLELAPQPRRRFMLKSILVKASVVTAVAVVGGGGVALAASTGHLPGTGSPDDHAATRPTTGATANATASAHANGHASHSPAAGTHRTGAAESHDARPSGSPSPNLRGLCTAFQAHAGDGPGKALDNPAFKVLVQTAGGRNKVASYCHTLLASPAGKPPTHPGSASTHATSHPTHSRPTPSHPAPSTTNTRIP